MTTTPTMQQAALLHLMELNPVYVTIIQTYLEKRSADLTEKAAMYSMEGNHHQAVIHHAKAEECRGLLKQFILDAGSSPRKT